MVAPVTKMRIVVRPVDWTVRTSIDQTDPSGQFVVCHFHTERGSTLAVTSERALIYELGKPLLTAIKLWQEEGRMTWWRWFSLPFVLAWRKWRRGYY